MSISPKVVTGMASADDEPGRVLASRRSRARRQRRRAMTPTAAVRAASRSRLVSAAFPAARVPGSSRAGRLRPRCLTERLRDLGVTAIEIDSGVELPLLVRPRGLIEDVDRYRIAQRDRPRRPVREELLALGGSPACVFGQEEVGKPERGDDTLTARSELAARLFYDAIIV